MAKRVEWALKDALVLIRDIQTEAMELGYYIALAGGVLNEGFSENDLDLVAVPRTPDPDREAFVMWIKERFTVIYCHVYAGVTDVISLCYGPKTLRIDLAIIDGKEK